MRSTHQTNRKAFHKPWVWLGLVFLVSGSVAADDTKKSTDWGNVASKMNNPQKLDSALKLRSNISDIYRRIKTKLDKANSEQDIVAVECLGNKLTQISALQFMVLGNKKENKEGDEDKLRKAVTAGSSENANHYWSKIAEAEARCRELEVEAEQCWGKQTVYDGNTKVEAQVPPGITKGDPTIPSFSEPVVYRPSNASSFF